MLDGNKYYNKRKKWSRVREISSVGVRVDNFQLPTVAFKYGIY